MADEAATATRTRRKVTATDPDGGLPMEDPGPIMEGKVPELTVSASLLTDYIAWRRAQLYKPRAGGHIGGAAAIEAQAADTILRELERLAEWMESGAPSLTVLSDTDKAFYRDALSRGLTVPDEIKAQL